VILASLSLGKILTLQLMKKLIYFLNNYYIKELNKILGILCQGAEWSKLREFGLIYTKVINR
jgi:hypothetical protein